MHLAYFSNGFGMSRISAVNHPKEKGQYDNLIAFGNTQIRAFQEEQQLINEVRMMQLERTANELVEDEIKIIEHLERKCGEVK